MEPQFRHHPDGLIYVNDVEIKLADFLTLEPEYALPEFFTGREYFPGALHRLYTPKSEIFLPDTWETGDAYIAKVEEYREWIEANSPEPEGIVSEGQVTNVDSEG